MAFYDYSVKDVGVYNISLENYKDKVILVVNVASKCGFTPQYEGLQALYEKYEDEGFMILGFPSNQFKNQEPGTNEEIQEFCRVNYGVGFPVFAKIDVNGENADPLYKYLKEEKPVQDDVDNEETKESNEQLIDLSERENSEDIIWNFEKFLIDRYGKVVGRYSPSTEPEELEGAIEELL